MIYLQTVEGGSMRASLFALVIIVLCTSCTSGAYVPPYILTDSPETKEEVHKHKKEEPDSKAPQRRSYEIPKKNTQ